MKISEILHEDVVPIRGSQNPGELAAAQQSAEGKQEQPTPPADLDWFTRGYMNAALMDWYQNRRNPDRSWQWSDRSNIRSLTVEDIDRPTQIRMIQDCEAFLKKHRRLLKTLNYPSEFAGQDFYVSRGGQGTLHGSSVVWDKIGKAFGPATVLYMGQDLKLHSELAAAQHPAGQPPS